MNIKRRFCPKGHDTSLVGRAPSNNGCKVCIYAISKKLIKQNRKKYLKIQRFSKIKSAYGITETEFNSILVMQSRRCAICCRIFDKDLRPAVDHCHKTNKVRGLLCINCNSILGHAHDDRQILKCAINYLRKADA